MSVLSILHVVVSLDPAQGGPPAVALRLAAAQAALGHDVAIASHDSPGRQAQIDQSMRGIPNIEKVRIIALPAELTLKAMVPHATRTALRSHMANRNIVHLHAVWEPLVHRAAIEAARLKIPYVQTLHGVLDPWCLQQRWLKKKIALALSYRSTLNRAACLHVLNQDEADLIKPLGLKAPARVIPNGVFLEEIEPLPQRGTFFHKHPELRNQPYILFLSRLHFKKGLDFLADAFAIVARQDPNVRLVVAGPDGGEQGEFESQIARANLSDRVHLVGPLWGPEKFAAMVDAVCFCLPSRQEGFSMAILEALACGTPVVISQACHFPEVATAGAGRVVPLEAQPVAEALLEVLSRPQRRDQMGCAGRELVLRDFTWPTIARQAVEMYAAAVGRGEGVRG